MRTALPLLLVLAGCAGGGDDPVDTDSDTEEPEESDVPDTDDTDPGETDVTPTGCTLTTPPTLDVRPTAPGVGVTITYVRTIEACAGEDGITGQWWIEITDDAGDLVCRVVSAFTADDPVTGDACEDCTWAFEGAVFGQTVRTTDDSCDAFGFEMGTPFYDVDGTETPYSALGVVTGLAPDVLHRHAEEGWVPIDDSVSDDEATVTRTAQAVGGETRVTVRYEVAWEVE